MRHRGQIAADPLPDWLLAMQSELAAEVITTHISWLLLTSEYVFKLKQPVRFPFLDYSTRAQRWECCRAEVQLNRRYAPELYLGVVALGTEREPAVVMRRFPESQRLDHVCDRGELTVAHMTELAEEITAHFRRAATPDSGARYGSPEHVIGQARETMRELLQVVTSTVPAHPDACAPEFASQSELGALMAEVGTLRVDFSELAQQVNAQLSIRQLQGCVREGHGDLHLSNLVLVDGHVTAFDCIEFNPEYRWLDVASEVAFPYIDLLDHQQPALAGWLLSSWLESSGDYAALSVFRFYSVYRTVVRALVAALQGKVTQVAREVATARSLVSPRQPTLSITHGWSGSGKTTAAAALVRADPHGGTVRVRADVERKRLHGLSALTNSASGVNTGIYSDDAHRRTYDVLFDAAVTSVRNGWSIVVDAAFLRASDRARFAELAATTGCRFAIVDCAAPLSVLQDRIRERSGDASEATLDVLAAQVAAEEPLSAAELTSVTTIG